MRLKGEPYGIDVGTFVMNYHHGLLRLGIVESSAREPTMHGWAYFDVRTLRMIFTSVKLQGTIHSQNYLARCKHYEEHSRLEIKRFCQ